MWMVPLMMVFHGVHIPDMVINFIKSKGFSVPDNHIIEMVNIDSPFRLLVEDKEYEENENFLTISVRDFKYLYINLCEIVNVAKSFKIGIADDDSFNYITDVENIKILYKSDNLSDAMYIFKNIISYYQGESNYRGYDKNLNNGIQSTYLVFITWN